MPSGSFCPYARVTRLGPLLAALELDAPEVATLELPPLPPLPPDPPLEPESLLALELEPPTLELLRLDELPRDEAWLDAPVGPASASGMAATGGAHAKASRTEVQTAEQRSRTQFLPDKTTANDAETCQQSRDEMYTSGRE
jgi:hypothetical protein